MRAFILIFVCFCLALYSQTTRKGIDNDASILAEIAKKGGYHAKGAKIKFRTDWALFEGKAQRGIEALYPKNGKFQKIDEDTVEYAFDLKKNAWFFHSVTHGDTKLLGFTPPDVAILDEAAYDALNSIPEKIMNQLIFKDTVYVFSIKTVAKDGKPGKLEVIDEHTIIYRVAIELLKKSGKKKCKLTPDIFWSNLQLIQKGGKWTVKDGEWEGRSILTTKHYYSKPTEEECAKLPQLGTTKLSEMYGEEKLPDWYRK